MRLATCPSPADLERLVQNGLADQDAILLEQHILECSLCGQRLAQLTKSDTIAHVMKQETKQDTFANSPVVEHLMQKLEGLRPGLVASNSINETRDEGTLEPRIEPLPAGSADPSASRNSRLTSFLSPAQSADELGRLGKYRILSILGHGGMGVVFKAEDIKLKRHVALKAMLPAQSANPTSSKRFMLEAEAMAAVEHDHVVRVYHVDEENGVPFLAMELLKGESLEERLKRSEALSIGEILRIGREIAEALEAAHATGLIHRDIKPANIWLEAPRSRVKILDFGLARACGQESGLTQEGSILGTPAYMAPEQTRGGPIDARTDLFSLGVVLYRLCTGIQPFHGKDTISTLFSVAADSPRRPIDVNPAIPRELSELVMQLLEKEPGMRIGSAAIVVEHLRKLERSRDEAGSDRTQRTTMLGEVKSPRRRLPLVAAACVFLAGMVGIGAFALIHIKNGQGSYVIDTDDPDFSFSVNKGIVILEDRKTKRKYHLKVLNQDKATGEHELEITDSDAGLSFKSKRFTIKRGEKVALKAWFERKDRVVKPLPENGDEAWRKRVAGMAAKDQILVVVARLKERNPKLTTNVTHKITDGVVTEIAFLGNGVSDLSPLRALPGLRVLRCDCARHSSDKPWQLTNLTGLKGMKLTDLSFGNSSVSDLSPLAGMPLTRLTCNGTPVADLSPLKGMRLEFLNCRWTMVRDLMPLKGMPLTHLEIGTTRVSDLAPLKGSPLKTLHFYNCPVKDLSPLEKMPLVELKFTTPVKDLTPLKGMQLVTLELGANVSDLSILKSMPLVELTGEFNRERHRDSLAMLKGLKKINGKPAAQFLNPSVPRESRQWLEQVAGMKPEEQVKEVVAKLKQRNPGFDGKVERQIENDVVIELAFICDKVTNIAPVAALTGLRKLRCQGSDWHKGQLADLSPLAGLKELSHLELDMTNVADLTPLKRMNLIGLDLRVTKVSDLSPLKDMPLNDLKLSDTKVSDLSPLKGKKLQYLYCGGTNVSNLEPLKGMPLLWLELNGTGVSSLAPLKGMKLENLTFEKTKVTDISPIRDMPLTYIRFDYDSKRDRAILILIKTLKSINNQPATDVLKEKE